MKRVADLRESTCKDCAVAPNRCLSIALASLLLAGRSGPRADSAGGTDRPDAVAPGTAIQQSQRVTGAEPGRRTLVEPRKETDGEDGVLLAPPGGPAADRAARFQMALRQQGPNSADRSERTGPLRC
jgi:hypothetical protein